MVIEAKRHKCHDVIDMDAPTGGLTANEVRCLPDGRAGVVAGAKNPAAGDRAGLEVEGIFIVQKTANIVLLDGGEVYWDHSANAAHFKKVHDRDFYIGTAYGDAGAGDTTMKVNLNVKPEYAVQLDRDPYDSVVVLTAGAPSVTQRGGAVKLLFDTTAEAQKCDALTKDGVAPGSRFIARFLVEVVTNGDNAAFDLNIGVANATHATDADAITEAVFAHIDGSSLNINAESDDGDTEVAATDTTVDFAAGTRFEFWIDARDITDIQLYIDGVNVLPDSVFKLDAASGPLKILAHMEKTANDSPGEVDIDFAGIRIQDAVG